MTYSEPLNNQIYRFILALGFGIILGLIYEIFVLIREIFSFKKSLIITVDILFSVLSAFLTFFFMLVYNDGRVRLNLIFASLMGLFAFHYTFGGRAIKPLRRFILKTRKLTFKKK